MKYAIATDQVIIAATPAVLTLAAIYEGIPLAG